jgi:hypothetical protein
MTTIFADLRTGVMVADTKFNSGDCWFAGTKVHRHGDELIGYAGNVKTCRAWVKWYTAGAKGARPKMVDFEALVLRADGLFYFSEDGGELAMERGYHGIGSGGAMAVAAFMAGATPTRAVEIACAIDLASGGEVQTYQRKLGGAP